MDVKLIQQKLGITNEKIASKANEFVRLANLRAAGGLGAVRTILLFDTSCSTNGL